MFALTYFDSHGSYRCEPRRVFVEWCSGSRVHTLGTFIPAIPSPPIEPYREVDTNYVIAQSS